MEAEVLKPVAVQYRYKEEVKRVFTKFADILYKNHGISTTYLGEADRRRVCELERRIRMLGLDFSEGVNILFSYWLVVVPPREPGRMPVRVITLVSKRSMQVLKEERRRRYPNAEWRNRHDPPTSISPTEFGSVTEWTEHLKKARQRNQRRVQRRFRR